uniref:Putative Phage integrase family protein n=1 Tax=mine drainage metagenome TaxID=410659 RepID=E6PHT0_9ZZZZ
MVSSVTETSGGGGGLPVMVLDVQGLRVDLSGSIWRLNNSTSDDTINWGRLTGCDPLAVLALQRHIIRLIESRSSRHAFNTARSVGNYLTAVRDADDMGGDATSLTPLLWYLEKLREGRTEYKFHHIRAWYVASADRMIEGFDDESVFALLDLRIPGNKKGFAVLSQDPDSGPLSEFEEAALRRALIRDTGPIQQRAALWLALAFGTNPANLSLLREEDFTIHRFDAATPPVYFLNIPRIKKRSLRRAEFKKRNVDLPLAAIIDELLAFNSAMIVTERGVRPLFRLRNKRTKLEDGPLGKFALHCSAAEITRLIAACVERLGVLSPRTGKPLSVTTRRLRYTFACKMVRQRVAPRDLAELLDHTDTQNVQVYYAADSRFVERLDQSIAEQIGPAVRAFMGTVVPRRDDQLVDLIPYRELPDLGRCGASFSCGLSAPKNCYTCTKFNAFEDGPHGAVLTALVGERDELLRDGFERIAEQLDETILAVGEVVAKTRGVAS